MTSHLVYGSVSVMKIDGRTLSHETSEQIRRMAVRRVEAGEKPSSVMASYGLCRTDIYRWLRAVKKGGEAALKARKAPGRMPKLTAKQKRQVRRWICGKDPRQYHFDFGLWTRQIVAELIEQKFGIHLSLSSVGRLLDELEITPQKPLRRAYERDPKAVEKWIHEDYPRLKTRAKRRGAEIFFLDERAFNPTRRCSGHGVPKGRRRWCAPAVSANRSTRSRRSPCAGASGTRSIRVG